VIVDVEVTTGEVNEGSIIKSQNDAVAAVTGTKIERITLDAGYAYRNFLVPWNGGNRSPYCAVRAWNMSHRDDLVVVQVRWLRNALMLPKIAWRDDHHEPHLADRVATIEKPARCFKSLLAVPDYGLKLRTRNPR
jgi:hypothetical protein